MTSTSGGPSTAAVKADALQTLAILVAQSRPWYEALGMTAERASGILGEDAQHYVSDQGSGLGGKVAGLFLSVADVDALKPVCVVFKTLFEAVKGAATNRDDLVGLINYGVMIVKSIPETGTASGLSPAVKYAIRAFGAEVESVMQLAGCFDATEQPTAYRRPRLFSRRTKEVVNHAEINKIIRDHAKQFSRIVGVLGTGAAVQSATEAKAVLDVLPNMRAEQRKEALRTRRAFAKLRKVAWRTQLSCVTVVFAIAAVWFEQVRLHTVPKLAPVPQGVPMGQSWHVGRDGKVERVCKILRVGGESAVAALTGRSGAGKTTAAAAMVSDRGHIRPHAGETEDQAKARLDCVRALFPDGVVWLRVGKGKGAADRLPPLMLELAKGLHADVMQKGVDAPAAGEDGESYVKRIVSQESLRCLVVADDVWEPSVVDKLRKTGMSVLLTTRFPKMVEPHERVVVDKLTETEAEDVLRGAAELPPSESLCDAAREVLEICGHVAMDIAFVGSWSSVRTTNGNTKSRQAWAGTVREIRAHIEDVRGQAPATNAGGMDNIDVNRLAVLRAGFKYLGREDPLAQELYVALAVFPRGHSFGASDAAVLLDDEEVAMGPISILERWAVLRMESADRYRMHDTHVEFARDKLMGWEDVRRPAVERWTSYISRLDFAIGISSYALLLVWRALEQVGGEGWWVSRPYDYQLGEMDSSDPLKILAVHAVAELYGSDQKFSELETLTQQVLEHRDGHGGENPEVQMAALYYACGSLAHQGRSQESVDVARRLVEMVGPGSKLRLPSGGINFAQRSTTFHLYGVLAKFAGHQADAEEWFRKAVVALEDDGRTKSDRDESNMFELGRNMRETGRPEEAEGFLKRALKIKEGALGADDLQVAIVLDELASSVREAGRPEEAEGFIQRSLEIREAKLGSNDVQVAYTLHELGTCVREAGRPAEAEGWFSRALEIFEVASDSLAMALMLNELSRCVREAGRPEEAEGFLKRELEIKERTLGANDIGVVGTLQEVGQSVREAGRPGEAEGWFRRALEIVKVASDRLSVALVLEKLGRCVWEAGRPDEAEGLLKRALEIKEADLGANDIEVAETLYEIGMCVRSSGRLGDAEGFLKQALEIFETKLESGDLGCASTLIALGRCVREAGRPGEAKALFQRALEIFETKLDFPGPGLAATLQELGRCGGDDGRPQEAEALFKRALEIQEAELGANDLQVAKTLYELGRVVREAGRPGEAEGFLTRALEIREAKLGSGDVGIVVTLYELGRSVMDAGRLQEADALLQRALVIQEANFEPDDLQIAATLDQLGRCWRKANLPGPAEGFLEQALEIKEAKLGSNDLHVAYTLQELGQCVREAGRPREAEALGQRALKIQEAKLGFDDLQVASTLQELGRCVADTGRHGKAEALFQRALEIQEAKLGSDDLQVAVTLDQLGWCSVEARRLGDAEGFLKRALQIKEAKSGAQDTGLALTLFAMGVCVMKADRRAEAEGFLKRALEIQEAKLGSHDLHVAYTLQELAMCVGGLGRPGEAEELFKRAMEIRRKPS